LIKTLYERKRVSRLAVISGVQQNATVCKVAVSVKVLILSHLQPAKIRFVALLFLLGKFLTSFRAYLTPFHNNSLLLPLHSIPNLCAI